MERLLIHCTYMWIKLMKKKKTNKEYVNAFTIQKKVQINSFNHFLNVRFHLNYLMTRIMVE